MDVDDTRTGMFERAEELGRVIAQMPEFAYLQAAHRDIGDDREATETLNRMRELQERLLDHLGRKEDPPEALQTEFADLQEKVQQSTRYQALISAQANFDKLMEKVHQAIGKGIRKGEESRIIIPS
jgi:cell fate (sporulation/competence/biofilm development) regulator YlbF (YheA/YmcA/DUF963 family)